MKDVPLIFMAVIPQKVVLVFLRTYILKYDAISSNYIKEMDLSSVLAFNRSLLSEHLWAQEMNLSEAPLEQCVNWYQERALSV